MSKLKDLFSVFRPSKKEKAWRALLAVGLARGDIAIDCGANVGEITEHLATTGATIYAFEPNPHAFTVLEKKFSNNSFVTCFQDAVLDQAGQFPLYLHKESKKDQVLWSTGSSLLKEKKNVSIDDYVMVSAVDLSVFINSLGSRIRVLKIDVEGAEVSILNKLIDSGVVGLIDHVFVETHEEKVPELMVELLSLKKRVKQKGLKNINFDWI